MTRSEALIVRTMEAEIEDGMDSGTALIRTANRLGIPRKQVAQVWVKAKAQV